MIQSLCLWNHVFSGFQEKASVIDDGYGGFVSSNIEVPIKKAPPKIELYLSNFRGALH